MFFKNKRFLSTLNFWSTLTKIRQCYTVGKRWIDEKIVAQVEIGFWSNVFRLGSRRKLLADDYSLGIHAWEGGDFNWKPEN